MHYDARQVLQAYMLGSVARASLRTLPSVGVAISRRAVGAGSFSPLSAAHSMIYAVKVPSSISSAPEALSRPSAVSAVIMLKQSRCFARGNNSAVTVFDYWIPQFRLDREIQPAVSGACRVALSRNLADLQVANSPLNAAY